MHRELLSNATTVVEAFESKNGSVLKIENDDNEDNDDYRTMLTTKTMMTTGTMKTIMTMRTMRAIREGTRTISSMFLAVHNSSIGDLSLTDSLSQSVTFTFDITE